PVHCVDIDIRSGQKRREKQLQARTLGAVHLRKSRTSSNSRAICRARILGIGDRERAALRERAVS
ncbi:hypothetical protein, partial [Stenotrophomonas sp. SrG]|uniref:hypothetical protein n=1 Tax=Stenotrophomonas sp. SrG TaxID=3414430 RepID=UPI003CF12C3B